MKTSLMGDPSLEIAGKRNELNQAGAGLAKTRFDMTAAMPVDNAFGESFEGMANDMGKTRGWKYVLQQAFRGLGAGAKSAANKENVEKLQNIASGMSFFEDQNKAMQQDIDGIQKKQQMKEKIEPYALSAMELSYSGQPYDVVNDKMRNLFDQVQLNNPEIRGKYIGFVPNSPLLNIRDENGKDAVISLASIAGEEKTKRIQGDWIEGQKLDAQQQGLKLQERGLGIQQQNANISQEYLNLEKQYAPQKYEAARSRIDETSRRNDIMEGRLGESGFKRIEAAKQKYLPKIEAAGRVERIVNKIEPIIKLYPEALQSVLNVVWNNNDEGVIAGAIKALAQQATDGKTAEAIAELGKYTSELKIGAVKGLNNPNQFIDKIIAATVPGKSMPPKSFLKILNDMKEQAQFDRKLNSDYLNDSMPSYGEEAPNYGDKYGKIIEDFAAKKTPKEESQNPISSLSTEDLLARKQQLMGMK